jgi:ATPases with chaperone activity, ATP-binding subunit
MFERFDPAARHVLETAWAEAAGLDDGTVATEHLLLALATADPVTADLLAEAGGSAADLRRAVAARCSRRLDRPRQHDHLLGTLGIDLTEVRRRAEQTFGADAVIRAAARARPRWPRRPLWSWISCSAPFRAGAATARSPASGSIPSRGSNGCWSGRPAPPDPSPPHPAICSTLFSPATNPPARS